MKRFGKAVVVGLLGGLSLASVPGWATPPAPTLAAGQRVDLNTASADELAKLPGIGPAKARAIVDHRGHDAFAKIDDLRKVKGIGAKLYDQVKDHVTVGDAGNAPSKAGRGG